MSLRNQKGFTIVELNIVLGMTALFVGLVFYFGMSYWRYASLMESDLSVFVSRLNAQDTIREIVGTSSGLITQNSIPDPNTLNSDPIAGSNYWISIHAVPGTTSVGTSGTTPLLYFRRIATTKTTGVAMNGTQPFEDEFVLYLDGSTKQLLMRTLANPAVSDSKMTTSCPPAIATESCPADKVIMEKLDSVESTYYSRSGITINYHSLTDPITGDYMGPDFPLVEALQYTFHVKDKPLFQSGNATVNDTIVRIALRNT